MTFVRFLGVFEVAIKKAKKAGDQEHDPDHFCGAHTFSPEIENLLAQPDPSVRRNRVTHRFMPLAIVVALDEHPGAQHGELAEQGAVVVGIRLVFVRVEEPENRRMRGR
ncbi:MAG TPA: hypothetical protein VK567_05650 [Bradyrhizobium sp.]|nr:hypothetical protein [Bradyrhizobium sp.]